MEILKHGMVSKRSVGKSAMSSIRGSNWKKRFLTLDYCNLTYYDKWWDVSTNDRAGASQKGQFKVSNIRGVEKVDTDAFSKTDVFQILYIDVEFEGEPIRALYVEADGAVGAGRSEADDWIAKIRSTFNKVGDVTSFMDKYCSGAPSNTGKYSCCQRGKDEIDLRAGQGCKNATAMAAQSNMQALDAGGSPPKLPTSMPPSMGGSSSQSMKATPTQTKSRPPAPSPSMRTPSSRASGSDGPALPPRPGGGISSGAARASGVRPVAAPRPAPGGDLGTVLENEPWFAKGWTSLDTSAKLMQMSEGSFYVRESASKIGAFAVDIKTNSVEEPIVAKRIYRTDDGFFRFEGDAVTYISMRDCLKNCSDFKISLPPSTRRRPQPSIRPKGTNGMSMKQRGQNIPFQSKRDPPALPTGAPPSRGGFGRQSSSASTGFQDVVNSRTLATDDEIYGMVSGDFEEVDLESEREREAGVGADTQQARDLLAITASKNSTMEGGGDGALRAKNKLWKSRPDVTEDMLASMDSKAIKRQEAIYELVYSEEAYLRDVDNLILVYLTPIQQKGLIDAMLMTKMMTRITDVQRAGKALIKDLKARQDATVVVKQLSDVLEKHVETVATPFYNYCEVVLEIRAKTTDATPELASFMVATMNSVASRGLSMDAYLLSPVQRMVRYPMLISEVEKATLDDPTEKYNLSNAHKRWKESVHTCNSRFAEIENWFNLKDLQKQLNYERVEGAEEIWKPSHKFGYRGIVKKGSLELCKLNEAKKKIVKRKQVEVMLFSDIFLFCKPVKVKKTGRVEMIVIKEAHRSLLDVDRFRSSGAQVDTKLENMIEIRFLSKDKKAFASGEADAGMETIYIKAKDEMTMGRWLDAFNPPREDEDIYQAWECPQFVVLKDWTPPRDELGDSMPLRKGEIVEVEKRGETHMKGRLKDPEPFASYNTSGYFPASYVKEIESHRKTAREVRGLAKQNMGVPI